MSLPEEVATVSDNARSSVVARSIIQVRYGLPMVAEKDTTKGFIWTVEKLTRFYLNEAPSTLL
jgi:hypothetical protein